MSTATAETAPSISGPWLRALALLDEDLRRTNAAPRTRRAYAVDTLQFACWADAQEIAPSAVGPRDVRRYLAMLTERELSATTTARKLAAIRALFRSQREHGHIDQSPADLLATPRRASHLPRVMKAPEVARLLDSIPAGGPLELRDRALFELAYACGLRAEEIVTLDVADVDHDAEQLRVEGKGSKTRFVPVGELALSAVRLYLERGRPALTRAPGRDAARQGLRLRRPARTDRASLRSRRYFSAAPGVGWAQATCVAGCEHGRRAPESPVESPLTPCATALRPTCSTVAPTCARSKSCSATRASRPLRSTLG